MSSESTSRTLYQRMDFVPFVTIHALALIGLFAFPLSPAALTLAAVLYFVRMFGITAGYHRYFSHRAFKAGRGMQFFLALLAMSSSQKGVLWWASHHRVHHKHSDAPGDVHSPVQRGFWYSHVGWLFDPVSANTKLDRVKDFAAYPELVLLDRFWVVPPVVLGIACYLALGWVGLFQGFFLGTVVLWHGTFTINSLAHVFGERRFATTDDSRNNFALALITLGEGWHNNHHHYQSSARNGFYAHEVDVTYYVLVLLEKLGLVSELRPVPERVLAEGRAIDEARERGVLPPPFVRPAE